MNPRTFTIVFLVFLTIFLWFADKDLERSEFRVMKGERLIVSTELQSAECMRTATAVKLIFVSQYNEDIYVIFCKPLDK